MHTRDFEYTDDDLIYADDDVKPYVYIHHNSDLSGEVTIMKSGDSVVSSVSDIEGIKIPGWMLIDLVGEHMASELISKLEQMDGREVLKLLAGV